LRSEGGGAHAPSARSLLPSVEGVRLPFTFTSFFYYSLFFLFSASCPPAPARHAYQSRCASSPSRLFPFPAPFFRAAGCRRVFGRIETRAQPAPRVCPNIGCRVTEPHAHFCLHFPFLFLFSEFCALALRTFVSCVFKRWTTVETRQVCHYHIPSHPSSCLLVLIYSHIQIIEWFGMVSERV
jgi:hypothetical protein